MSLDGKRVIVIGDSHTDTWPFGSTLVAGLQGMGASVTVLAIGATASRNWLSRKRLCRGSGGHKKCQSLKDVDGQQFDLAIIAMGTNDAANYNREAQENGKARRPLMEKAADEIRRLASRVAPAFIWVGPPTVKGTVKWYSQDAMDELYEVAYSNFGSGVIIDSRPFTSPPIGDGVHISGSHGVDWANGVVQQIASMSVTAPEASAAQIEVAKQEDKKIVASENRQKWAVAGLLAAGLLTVFLLVRKRRK